MQMWLLSTMKIKHRLQAYKTAFQSVYPRLLPLLMVFKTWIYEDLPKIQFLQTIFLHVENTPIQDLSMEAGSISNFSTGIIK